MKKKLVTLSYWVVFMAVGALFLWLAGGCQKTQAQIAADLQAAHNIIVTAETIDPNVVAGIEQLKRDITTFKIKDANIGKL